MLHVQGKIQGEKDRWKASYFLLQQNLDSEIMKLVIMIGEVGGVGKQSPHLPPPFHNLGSATGLVWQCAGISFILSLLSVLTL